MGIWQLVCATDIKRVARSPERVREVADTYFDVKVSMRTDLSLAERRARLGEKYHELLRRVPAHTHAEVRAAQEAAVAKLDVLARGEASSPAPSSPAAPLQPAPSPPAAPRATAPTGRARLASPGGPRYADVVAGGASAGSGGSPRSPSASSTSAAVPPAPEVAFPPDAFPPPAATRSAPHSPALRRVELEGPRPRGSASASDSEAPMRRSYAEVARRH